MNIKYKKAAEQFKNENGTGPTTEDILKRLDIKDTDKFDKVRLQAIEKTVAVLNEGASFDDAVRQGLAVGKEGMQKVAAEQAIAAQQSNAIAPQQSSAIAPNVVPSVSDEVRKMLDGPLIEEGRQVVNGAVPEIAQSAQEAKQDVVGGLGQYAKSMVYKGAQEAFESEEWQQAVIDAIRGGKQ